ncbi:SHOCT domain-containing protein [Pantanalinema rosaneae CENA516]|uniref:SHOCT domain-containing protein n=1 Tax=Pantanalinema rosaneae TaxID=1620701 RepID=UPI003D6E0791
MVNRSGVHVFSQPRNRKVASLLAFAGAVAPVAGFHKFYLRQPVWGVLYLLLSWTPIPRVASAIEGIWYLAQETDRFDQRFNYGIPSEPGKVTATSEPVDTAKIGAIADAVRQLDQLRADGLISEYEFEQKRRQLLDRLV